MSESCFKHPKREAVHYCDYCGRPICADCIKTHEKEFSDGISTRRVKYHLCGFHCYLHKDEPSIASCGHCGKLICRECVIFHEGEDGAASDDEAEIRCPKCEDWISEIDLDSIDVPKNQYTPGLKLPFSRYLLIIFATLVFVRYQTCSHIGKIKDDVIDPKEYFITMQAPEAEMAAIMRGLFAYFEDKGKYPPSLDKLYGKYIDFEPTVLNTGQEYLYSTTLDGFKLGLPNVKSLKNYPYEQFWFTEAGLPTTDPENVTE